MTSRKLQYLDPLCIAKCKMCSNRRFDRNKRNKCNKRNNRNRKRNRLKCKKGNRLQKSVAFVAVLRYPQTYTPLFLATPQKIAL